MTSMFGFKLIFVRTRTNGITLNFKRCYHAIIVLLIFENVFYLQKKGFIMCYFSSETSLFV